MNTKATILIADDDEDDLFLVHAALQECENTNPTACVSDGLEVLDYLRRASDDQPVGLVLLDLNMPRMNGREVLKIIKSDKELRKTPVVVLTTSKSQHDIDACYDLGANSYIVKPASFEVFNETIATLVKYWIDLAQLPALCLATAVFLGV